MATNSIIRKLAAAPEAEATMPTLFIGHGNPPHVLLLGSDAIQVVGASLDANRGALKAWETTSSIADFPT